MSIDEKQPTLSIELPRSTSPPLTTTPEQQSVMTDEEWTASRKAGLPKGVSYIVRSSGVGKYEFYLPKLFRKRYKNSWGELYKIEAIREYKKFKIEYNRVKIKKGRKQRDAVRRMAIKREQLYYADKERRSKAKRSKTESRPRPSIQIPDDKGDDATTAISIGAASSSSTVTTPTTPRVMELMSPCAAGDEDWLTSAFQVPSSSTAFVGDDVVGLGTELMRSS